MSNKCLFSAPSDFLVEVFEGLPFVVDRRCAWKRDDLVPDPAVTAWVTNTGWKFQLGRQDLDLYPRLRVVVTPSTGCGHIDVEAVRERGIEFLSLLDDREGLEDIAASAEFAFLLLLNTLRRLPHATHLVTRGHWRRDDETSVRGHELQGRRVGFVGMGRIGRRLTRYCEAFGATTAWFDPYVDRAVGTYYADLADLFGNSDCVVISCTLSGETEGMIGASLFRCLPVGATLVNISRGEILVERDLAAVLRDRPDLAVGLDVLTDEAQNRQFESPLMPLVDQGRIVVTPHIAGATYESQTKAAHIALGLVSRALQASSEDNGT